MGQITDLKVSYHIFMLLIMCVVILRKIKKNQKIKQK